jgi:hypothetical protein
MKHQESIRRPGVIELLNAITLMTGRPVQRYQILPRFSARVNTRGNIAGAGVNQLTCRGVDSGNRDCGATGTP